jgi:hypothetical protein
MQCLLNCSRCKRGSRCIFHRPCYDECSADCTRSCRQAGKKVAGCVRSRCHRRTESSRQDDHRGTRIYLFGSRAPRTQDPCSVCSIQSILVWLCTSFQHRECQHRLLAFLKWWNGKLKVNFVTFVTFSDWNNVWLEALALVFLANCLLESRLQAVSIAGLVVASRFTFWWCFWSLLVDVSKCCADKSEENDWNDWLHFGWFRNFLNLI